tara:strand:- start:52 stop:270 length:219 start_codon:yes stop_codon:yes gene_type:complete
MKAGDKLKVIDDEKITQTYINSGSTCEYVKSFDNYACVLFNGCEYLVNKKLLVPVKKEPTDIEKELLGDVFS